ncbi:cysteine dioxygenase [Peterkaempfera bronchialis]|uniref:cysteine dioxygenase n=1 Tax=Peterkaempfera bronchialis TaxID=2126346 RepID=UPI001E2E88CD|nr:cysteine dioxygenase family protein [Peterkaempfera bronchialis]
MHRTVRPTAVPRTRWTDGLSDLSIAGDPLAFPHLAVENAPGHPTTVAGFAALARSIAADRARWRPLVRYDALTRWYARLETGPGYEVWLLSWLPGQSSGLHDHGASTGVLTVVQGELAERSVDRSGESVRALAPGSVRVLPGRHGRSGQRSGSAPGYLHEMVNTTLEPAVSIHVYSPGLVEMNQYGQVAAARRQSAYEGA